MKIGPLIALLGCAYIFAHVLSAFFQRTRIPDVLILALVGVLIGPFLGIVKPSHFGVIGPIASTATLAVLLFNSGTTLKLSALGSTAWRVVLITASTFVVTVAIVTALLFFMFELPVAWGFLCGVIVGGTSSAIVIPMAMSSPISEDMKTILVMESTLTDVLVIVLAFALLGSLKGESFSVGFLVSDMVLSFAVAAVVGVLGGFLWLKTWHHVRQIPDTVLGTLAYAFIFFGIVELMGYSGGIAALAFGVTIANVPIVRPDMGYTQLNHMEKSFYNEILFILKIFFFIYLGVSIELKFNWLMLVAFVSVVFIYVARLWLTRLLFPRHTHPGELTFASTMVPKGLAAAVVAGVPLQQGLLYGEEIRDFVYFVVMFSIILTSILVPLSEHSPLRQFYAYYFRKFSAPPNVEKVETKKIQE